MAKAKSMARLTYEVERSLQARARAVENQRGGLYGIDQPGHPRKKKGDRKPKEISKDRRLDSGENGAEAELDIVEEIKGTGIGRSPISGDTGPRVGVGAAPVRQPGESRLSYLKRWKRWKLKQ